MDVIDKADLLKQQKARNAVSDAIKSGKIKKAAACTKCGSTEKLEAHHKDGYDEKKLLEVTWLCRGCHLKEHVKLNKKAKLDSVFRIDFLHMPDLDSGENYMEERFKQTPEGFLKGRAIVTNVGVFQYRAADGSIRNELRPPEEVFAHESMQTLEGLPLGNEHPKNGVIDIDNIKKEQVGFSGTDIRRDEYHLSVPLTWTDAQTIDDIHKGKRALSSGYRTDIEEVAGVWMGIAYDAIQRNIRYNHIVLTDVGRAGDNAVLKMDSVNALGVQEIKKQGVESMKKIRIDGVEYDAEAPVIAAYTKTQDELKTLKEDNSTQLEKVKTDSKKIEAERDQLKEENETLKNDAKESKETKPEVIEAAVQARVVVLDAARRSEVEVKEDMAEADIKKAIVLKLNPAAKEKLDSADTVYIEARFDMALEKLAELEEERKDTSDTLKGDGLGKVNKSEKKADSKTAYRDMVERDTNAWKPEQGVN